MGKLYCGTSGWAYPTWRPDFYPAKLGATKFLGYYAGRLNSVEVNYTFRRLPSATLLARWATETPTHFRFAIKAHQAITHFRRLRDAAEPVAKFFESLAPLRDTGRAGPILLQLPPNLRADPALLTGFLDTWPPDWPTAIEFRHESWFTAEVYALLRQAGIALCQAEASEGSAPPVATAAFTYFRWRKDNYTGGEVMELAQRARKLLTQGDVFAFFKHEDTAAGARWAEQVLAK